MKWVKREYNGYRGRRTAGESLRTVAAVLLVLVLLAVTALIVGQRYIIYTDDGPRLELPFLPQSRQDEPELDGLEIVVEEKSADPQKK